jgi:hypothetical protein
MGHRKFYNGYARMGLQNKEQNYMLFYLSKCEQQEYTLEIDTSFVASGMGCANPSIKSWLIWKKSNRGNRQVQEIKSEQQEYTLEIDALQMVTCIH